MQIQVKTFSELSGNEVYQLLQLRSEVFVVEQTCIYQDIDGKDQKALHVLGVQDGELAAYARIFKAGDYFKEIAIGRVVVNMKFRGRDLGKALMQACIDYCEKQLGGKEIVISAQLYLERFYTELGFVREGDVYPEDDIPHIRMRKTKTQD